LTGGQRIALLADATIYGVGTAKGQTQFKSSTQYLAYRKAQTIARSTNGPGPVPSVIVTDLQESYRASTFQTFTSAFNVLTSPSTTVINSTGEGYLNNVYWKVSDTTSSVWADMPTLIAVHQIASITLSFYSGYSDDYNSVSDARFTMERGTSPFLNSILLFYAYKKRVVPPQAGDVAALGSPDPLFFGPITYPNTSVTITNQSFLRAFFGNGTDTIDRSTGFQFYWFTGYSTTYINNSQINEFVINYSYSGVCPASPFGLPSAPFGLRVAAGDGSATVTWSPPASYGGSDILDYTVTATPDLGLGPRIQYQDVSGYHDISGGFGSGFLNGVYYPPNWTPPREGVVTVNGFPPLLVTGLLNGTAYTFTAVNV